MIKHKLLASGLCLFFLTSAVLAQQAEEAAAQKVKPLLGDDIVRKIKAEGLENSKVMEHLDYLTNSIGHRLTGSDNYNMAARWARDQFKEWGLDAKLEKWGEWPESWNRGQWTGRVVSPIKMDLQVATEAWTVGTKGRAARRRQVRHCGRRVPVPGRPHLSQPHPRVWQPRAAHPEGALHRGAPRPVPEAGGARQQDRREQRK
ncbi:MAG: hypothetical protein ACYS5W_00835 [Planctomycetota bacterium]|jgi:hypothetical protein